MPILHSWSVVCGRCGKEFPWIYYEMPRMRLNGPVVLPEAIPTERTMVHSWREDGAVYHAAVNCPHCDYDNFFDGVI